MKNLRASKEDVLFDAGIDKLLALQHKLIKAIKARQAAGPATAAECDTAVRLAQDSFDRAVIKDPTTDPHGPDATRFNSIADGRLPKGTDDEAAQLLRDTLRHERALLPDSTINELDLLLYSVMMNERVELAIPKAPPKDGEKTMKKFAALFPAPSFKRLHVRIDKVIFGTVVLGLSRKEAEAVESLHWLLLHFVPSWLVMSLLSRDAFATDVGRGWVDEGGGGRGRGGAGGAAGAHTGDGAAAAALASTFSPSNCVISSVYTPTWHHTRASYC